MSLLFNITDNKEGRGMTRDTLLHCITSNDSSNQWQGWLVCLITCQGAGDELGHRELFLLIEKPRHVLVQAGDVNKLQLGGIFLSTIIKKYIFYFLKKSFFVFSQATFVEQKQKKKGQLKVFSKMKILTNVLNLIDLTFKNVLQGILFLT